MTEWEKLREELLANPMKNTTVLASIPRHEPARIMMGSTDGIYPVHEPVNPVSDKSKYYERVRK